ncbi:efflux RND transporter permease subunit [Salisaeta longa]|uniref:efflux RND transporter permease subunit n=1 Tax=Salisaeta longa TaxID=503170 RepID=UPI001E446778|nr:efflux RND transporter permease subunit [Salisaeta longa]
MTDVSIRRPVATTMAFLVVITVGIVSFTYLPVDLLPEIEYPRLTVYTNYANVGPVEMEKIITDPLENALSGVPNVQRMTSQSEQGGSYINLEFAQGTNLNAAANDVRAALDRIRDDLPREAEPPGIWKFDPNSISVVDIAAVSQRPLPELTRIMERDLAKQFEQIEGVGTIEIEGAIRREVRVALQRDRLQALDLSAQEVQQALAQANSTVPGGNVKDGIKNLYVRPRSEFSSIDQIRNTVVAMRDGQPIRVSDVADVIDGYEDIRRLAELNNVPIVRMSIQKQSNANTVSVANEVRAAVERINAGRNDLTLTVISDQSEFIQKSINNVKSSAIWGSLLALLVLYLFLRNGSTTFIIATAIPISIIATFGLLYFGGLTLNQMTFGGLALGVGMIVDNAIVVLENIVRQREENGRSLKESARIGTREVAGAVIASTLTTSVIFLPLVFARTTSAALFQALALVVVFALFCSLLVALTLVPMLASRFLSVSSGGEAQQDPSAFQRLFRRLENRYKSVIRWALQHRTTVFGTTAVLLVGAVVLWPLVPVELAPQTDTSEIDIELEMAQGTNIAVVNEYLEELNQKVRPLLPKQDMENYAKVIRGDDGEIEIRLKPAGERTTNSFVLADRIREAVMGTVPGAQIRVEAQSGLWVLRRVFSSGSGTQAVQVELRGYDLDAAQRLSQQIKQRLQEIPGVTNVRSGRREGRPEQDVLLNRSKIARIGLTPDQVANALQTNVGGSRAGVFREDGEQIPIMVRLRPQDRLTTEDLRNVSVRTPSGENVPISALVTTRQSRGPTSISRINGQRVTYISASLETGIALGTAVERIRADLSTVNLPEGFSITYGGEYREQQQAQSDFLIAIIMALILIYMVMAGQFERFFDPLIVMCSVPLALVGVIPTLLLTNTTLNIQSVMGIIMLIGIVVNNAIVLMDYINLLRREQDLSLEDAVAEAGRLRLRPILMTTLTTVLGLLPLALGLGAGAEIQAALARTVIGGLTASTLITLVLIPTAYVSAERLKRRVQAQLPNWHWLPSGQVAPSK